MNPLLLLFGLLGIGAVSGGSSTTAPSANSARIVGAGDDKQSSSKTPLAKVTKTPPATSEETSDDDTPEPVVLVSKPSTSTPTTTDTTTPPSSTSNETSDGSSRTPSTVASDPTPTTPTTPSSSDPTPTTPSSDPTPTTPSSSNPGTGLVGGTIPQAPTQSGDGGGGVDTTPISTSQGTVQVVAGRVATLDTVANATEVRIVSDVNHGSVTVNPDNTIALVMTQSEFVGNQSLTYEATLANGTTSLHTVNLNVTPGLQDDGWGTGEQHYMLATDADDRIIVEHGEVHTKVYVSGASDALSLADIAQAEGVPVSQVTGAFIANHGGYGQSEALALAEDAGRALWQEVSGDYSQTSNWLLLERGYEYDNMANILLGRSASGESEMNPLYIGAWGTGDRPELTSYSAGYLNNNSSSNIVIQDLHFSGGFRVLSTENIIFDGIKVTDEQMALMHSSGVTVRNSEFYDNTTDASANSSGTWSSAGDRQQGLYANNNDGMLVEGLFLDHNGWEDGYNYNASVNGVQPPGIHSHNLYFNTEITDLTVRDSISMRGGSNGMILRSGGFFEDLALIDNNSAIVFKGGDHDGQGQTGSYSLLADSIVTSGAHRDSAINTGGLTLGIRDEGELSSLVDNIVAHLADPNNAAELASKTITHSPLNTQNTAYDDTIVYNWEGSGPVYSQLTNQNTGSLQSSVLDETTIQNFTAQLLGQDSATIADLADYLRAQGDGAFDDVVDADLIIRFFQQGFGIAPDIRGEADTLRFVPNDIGEGVRWDNRLNWDTEDLPGLFPEDDVDLGGNEVVFGTNAEIDELDFGDNGALNIYGGRLDATGGMSGDGGQLTLEGAGQAWIGGADGSDDIDIDVTGGRFVNTGHMSGTDLTATGGQTILATGGAEYEVSASKTLAIFNAAGEVGFDGDDGEIALLDMEEGSTVAFSAGGGRLGTIEEFRSGAMGDAPDVQSGIDLGNSTLSIDLSGLTGGSNSFTLMDADEIVGIFNEALIDGLGARNANVVIDYENDTVTLQLSSGNGSVNIETVGQQTDVSSGEQSLWNALTEGQGVFSETAQAQVPGEDDLMDAA